MPYFTVTVEYQARDVVIIEAENIEDAREMAKDTSVFIEEVVSREAIGEINIIHVEEMKNDQSVE